MRIASGVLAIMILTGSALAELPHTRIPREDLAALWAKTWRADRNEPIVFVPAWGRTVSSLTSDHGSPWDYDTHTPLILYGPGRVRPGRYAERVFAVDLMPTVSRILGRRDDPTLPGRPISSALTGASPPRAVLTVVLDQCGYHALSHDLAGLPTLARLARQGAWFDECHVDYLPTITALFHCVLGTGRYPVENGISSDKLWNPRDGKYHNAVDDGDPAPILVPTLMELWQREQGGRPRIISISPAARATVELSGHRGAEPPDNLKVAVWWDDKRERWATHERHYRLPRSLAGLTLKGALGPLPRRWLAHSLATPKDRSRAPLMADMVAESLCRLIADEKIGGRGGPADLVHITFKDTDTAGHDHGNGSPEFRDALRRADRALGRVIRALEAQTGPDGLVVLVTADHGGLPESLRQAGARVPEDDLETWLLERLPVKPGRPAWLRDVGNPQLYLLESGLRANGYTVERIARVLAGHPALAATFTGRELRELQARQKPVRGLTIH